MVKTKSLENLAAFTSKDMDMAGIINLCWTEKKLLSIFKVSDFKRCSESDIQQLDYATVTCTVETHWNTLIGFIFGANDVNKYEYIFVEALCMDHSRISADKRRVMEQQSKIFKHSKEHHIIESACFLHYESWYYFSFFDRTKRPILHSRQRDPSGVAKIENGINGKGFNVVFDSTNIEDETIEFVKRAIVDGQYGCIEGLNARVRDIFVKAREVAQVCSNAHR